MSEIKLDLNSYVRVKLTEVGIARYRSIYDNHPSLTEDGEYQDQLWSLMSDFGDMLGNGLVTPFESTTIIVEPLKL